MICMTELMISSLSKPRRHLWLGSARRAAQIASLKAYVTSAGFEEVEHYYRPPGLPRH